MFHIKALVALPNGDINQYVARVTQASEAQAAPAPAVAPSARLSGLAALLALAITGCACGISIVILASIERDIRRDVAAGARRAERDGAGPATA